MSDLYFLAAKKKLRFPSVRGLLTVEHLFDLPLTSTSGFDLNTVAKTVNSELKSVSEESFVENTSSNPKKTDLEISLNLIKDVIANKQKENAANLERLRKREQREKILNAIEAKEGQILNGASLEDLKKKLAELD